MGSGYEVICKKCGYTQDLRFGIGFRYPRVCEEILEEMKSGAFGKRFMNDANTIPNVAVHASKTLFVCDTCGAWKLDYAIDLCTPVKDKKNRTGRFSVAIDYPKEIPYVMPYELKYEYSIIRSKQHRCGKCKTALRPMKKNEKLICPECGNTLKKGDEIFWD